MNQCKNCGKEISGEQHVQFKAMCSECFQVEKHGSAGETCHQCEKLAFEKCDDCQIPLYKEHTNERWYPPRRGARQCEKCWKKTNRNVAILIFIGLGTIIGIVVAVGIIRIRILFLTFFFL